MKGKGIVFVQQKDKEQKESLLLVVRKVESRVSDHRAKKVSSSISTKSHVADSALQCCCSICDSGSRVCLKPRGRQSMGYEWVLECCAVVCCVVLCSVVSKKFPACLLINPHSSTPLRTPVSLHASTSHSTRMFDRQLRSSILKFLLFSADCPLSHASANA